MKMYFFMACLFLAACTGGEKSATYEGDFHHIDFRPLLEKPVEQKSLTEWSKQVSYLPLQLPDSIAVKNIQRIILQDDKLLVVHDDRLSLFDTAGKYLHAIGRKGEGEGEYRRMFGLTLRNDTLYVNNGNYDFVLYTWDGQYLGKRYHPHIRHLTDYFLIPNSDIWLGHVLNFIGNKEIRLAFFRDTTVLKTIPYLKKYEPASGNVAYNCGAEMKAFDGPVPAFKELFNDTIYQADAQLNLLPYAVVYLGDRKFTREIMYAHTAEQLMGNGFDFFTGGEVALLPTGEKDGVIYLTNLNPKDLSVYSYSYPEGKTRIEQVYYPEGASRFAKGATFVPRFISTDGRYLIDCERTENGGNPVVVLVER